MMSVDTSLPSSRQYSSTIGLKRLAALDYASRGFKIFPCVPGDKKPLTTNGFHDATDDRRKIEEWWTKWPDANIAFQPQTKGWVVIDADDYASPTGDALFEAECKHGPFPETFTVRTARGGRHLYYRGEAPPSQKILGEHIDTRGGGSYALLPPSTLAGYGEYRTETKAKVAELPDWIPKVLHAAKRPRMRAANDIDLDTEWNIARARSLISDLVDKGEVAIEGQGGDKQTYVAACEVMEVGVSEDVAFELLLKYYNPHCQPPWDDDELREKVHNAALYGQNDAGAYASSAPSDAFMAYARTASAPSTAGLSFQTVQEILERPPVPLQELIPDFVAKRITTFIEGAGGSSKSRLALQIGLCLSEGAPVLDKPASEKATFFYISYEDDQDEVGRRVHGMKVALGLSGNGEVRYLDLHSHPKWAAEPLAIISEESPPEETDLGRQLVAALQATPGHKLVVIDSLYNALHFRGAAKINEGAVMRAVRWLDRQCQICDCTILVLFHPSQAGEDREAGGGWSVAWRNAPRARIGMTERRKERSFEISCLKRTKGAPWDNFDVYYDRGSLSVTRHAAASESDERRELLRAVAKIASECAEKGVPLQRGRHPPPWVMRAVKASFGALSTKVFQDALHEAATIGLLTFVTGETRKAAGYYPPDAAEELARAAKQQMKERKSLTVGKEAVKAR